MIHLGCDLALFVMGFVDGLQADRADALLEPEHLIPLGHGQVIVTFQIESPIGCHPHPQLSYPYKPSHALGPSTRTQP